MCVCVCVCVCVCACVCILAEVCVFSRACMSGCISASVYLSMYVCVRSTCVHMCMCAACLVKCVRHDVVYCPLLSSTYLIYLRQICLLFLASCI